MQQINQDYDSPWKDILETYFQEFMVFFFPRIEEDLNWEKGYEFLDKEFQGIAKEAAIGRKYLDKLIRVWRKDDYETWLLIHIEVQGTRETDFPERMYVYNYRAYDKYRKPVASLAVLTDESISWRPDRFGYKLWGCEASLRFPVVKILDFNNKEEELLKDNNPFALVALAQLKAMETRNNPETRTRLKFNLMKQLYQKGYSKKDVIQLFSFIDWVMSLPEEFSRRFWNNLISFEEEHNMPYVTSVEKIGIKKGMQQGRREGLVDAIEMGLSIKFGAKGIKLLTKIKLIKDTSRLEMIKEVVKAANNISEIKDAL